MRRDKLKAITVKFDKIEIPVFERSNIYIVFY